MGFYAQAVAAKTGILMRNDAVLFIRKGFDEALQANKGNYGWLYHFTDLQGKPTLNSEVSSIDTVLFYLGAERAAILLEDLVLLEHIKENRARINLSVIMDTEGIFYHSFARTHRWTNYDEGVLLYKYFNKPFTPKHTRYSLPLFVYFYPITFYNEAVWTNHLNRAIAFQIDNTGHLGYTACDGRYGYEVNSPYYISPLAEYCCDLVLGKENNKDSRLVQSISLDRKWKSQDRILLDDGILLMLLMR